jgi:general secretion pathway protein E
MPTNTPSHSTSDPAQPIDLEGYQVDPLLVSLFPVSVLFRESVLPMERAAGRVRVAMSDTSDFELIEELTAFSNCLIDPVAAPKSQIDKLLKGHFGVGGGTITDMLDSKEYVAIESANVPVDDENEEGASVIKLVNELLIEAIQQQASDIHIEPVDDEQLEIRFRIDGRLHVQPTPPGIHRFKASIISRLKIMANLNIAEKRKPQDGRIQLRALGRQIDVRVSIIPMIGGEGVVMRLLDKSNSRVDLTAIALPSAIRSQWNDLIRLPHGMVLVTGPTGSGKTTTLYSSIASIRAPDVKIVTIEDPVEYRLEQVSQIQVHRKVGLDFASGLRSILRHDPDIVLIGEVRDAETAKIAVQASLTGHLVFCTLHTNDAPSAYARLVDMGIEPYLVASTVQGVLAQRLVRRLCKVCRRVAEKEIARPSDLIAPADFLPHEAVGCRACLNTGYSGRAAIFELMVTDATTRRLVTERADTETLRRHALAYGMQSLRQSGWQRVLAGETTIEEVGRVATSESL